MPFMRSFILTTRDLMLSLDSFHGEKDDPSKEFFHMHPET